MPTYEVELPAFYVDALTLDSSPSALVVASRSPEPNAEQVSKATNIELLLVATTSGPTISVGSTSVYVGGALAFNAGAFIAGFSGTAGAVAGPTAMYRIVLNPDVDFLSETVVSVRVVSATSVNATLDTTYAFTIEDLTAPLVIAAQALSHDEVQVSFDEPLRQVDAAASNDALNPANYTVSPLGFPAVSPTVLSVRALTTSVVVLTLDQRASFDKPYRVTVVNVTDVFENVVAPPYNTADFVAPACPKPATRNFDVYRMLPEMNRREDDTLDLLKFASCLQEVVDLLLCEVDRFSDFLDPDATTQDGVRAMLADLANPFTFDLSDEEERRLVQLLVPLYKQKGTEPGIRNAIRLFLDLDITVVAYLGEGLSLGESELGVNWILGPSTSFMRFAFDVLAATALNAAQRERIRSIVEYMKPAHTHFVNLVEPTVPETIDHLELGISELGNTWDLHGS